MSASAPPLPLNVKDLIGRLSAREAFAAFARRPEAALDLLEGALLAAREEYPHLDPAAYKMRVRGMAGAVQSRLAPGATTPTVLAALNEALFQEEGFRGDRDTYYDPRNSYLNEVIDRRRGIPITLSIVYLEVGRRLGLPLHGVNFPGHFLVGCRAPGHSVLIDPFEEGRTVSREDCETRLKATQGEEAVVDERMLRPVGARQILYRLLNNLKGIYMKDGEIGRALSCTERMLMLVPESATDRRDRGILLLHLDFPALAQRDLEAYLLARPAPGDAGPVFERLKALQQHTRHGS